MEREHKRRERIRKKESIASRLLGKTSQGTNGKRDGEVKRTQRWK